MSEHLFSNFSCDYYVRCHKMKRKDKSVTIYVECYRNESGANDDYYALDLYLSVDDYSLRQFMVGVTFGKAPMDQKTIDTEMDSWIEWITTTTDYPLSKRIASYMRSVKACEDVENSIIAKVLRTTDDED